MIKMANVASVTWLLILALLLADGALASGGHAEGESLAEEEGEFGEPATAILFPWFCEALGVIVFFLLTRYATWIPFTSVLFLLGTFMGIGAVTFNNEDQLTESIYQWGLIDSEVLILVFLPGLIFVDAYNTNVHLFQLSLTQCLTMAFPMVLAGTTLVACVGFFVFPYNWSFNLAMTFGAILSATDPVAVSALLNEVGAPPRLKVHISGESLLNDGSAIVFYTIFSLLYLTELGQSGLGEEIDLGKGVAIFFRMSLGGACIGLLFGVGLIGLLYMLNRRLNMEENVLQIMATITIAYLTFYTAEIVAHTSGVIAVVVCGVVTKKFGGSMINDRKMMESFWLLVESLLNTLIFALGGVVWGEIIANSDARETTFGAKEWGYLFLLYILLMAIRSFLFVAFYPVLANAGLKTCWQETVFMSFGGLRGAVGIALAIALDNEVFVHTDSGSEFRTQTNTLMGMVGGIAFLTLTINGTLSGPLLRKLGLANESETRQHILEGFCHHFREHMLQDFIHKLCDERFQIVDFGLIEHHVPYLRGLTVLEFEAAVQQNKEHVPALAYKAPYTESVLEYLRNKAGDTDLQADKTGPTDMDEDDDTGEGGDSFPEEVTTAVELTSLATGSSPRQSRLRKSIAFLRRQSMDESSHLGRAPSFGTDSDDVDEATMKEMRNIFIELLRAAYQKQIDKGELDGRMAFVDYVLLESLEFSSDRVAKGEPLNDFNQVQFLWHTWSDRGDRIIKRLFKGRHESSDTNISQLRVQVHVALSFVDAHYTAQKCFKDEFCKPPYELAGKLVAKESKQEVHEAMDFLKSAEKEDVKMIISHLLCTILLNKFARYVESVAKLGFLKEKEAAVYLEEIEEELEEIHTCHKRTHSSVAPTGGVLRAVEAVAADSEALPTRRKFSPRDLLPGYAHASSSRW